MICVDGFQTKLSLVEKMPSKYTPEKRKAIAEMSRDHTYTEVIAKYHCSRNTILSFRKEFGIERKYNNRDKLDAAMADYLGGKMTQTQAAEKHGVNKTTLNTHVRNHGPNAVRNRPGFYATEKARLHPCMMIGRE